MTESVSEMDRQFSLRLNAAEWSSPAAREEAMRPLAEAQLGTAGTDRWQWSMAVTEGTIKRVVPIALRAAADGHPDESMVGVLRAAADRCEKEGHRAFVYSAVREASVEAEYPTNADYAVRAASAAAEYAADAYTFAFIRLADDWIAYAVRTADAAVSAALWAAGAADRDNVLRVAVQVALDAYKLHPTTPASP